MVSQNKKIQYLTFGSPIMDMIVDVDGREVDIIKEFSLKLDTTSHTDKSDEIFNVISKMNPTYVAGGCSYNAIRVLNMVLKQNKVNEVVGCLGSIGNDENGKSYMNLLEKEEIAYLFQKIDNDTTGLCATICQGRDRCHRTNLGASTKISEEYVKENWELIKDVKLVYTELYILVHKKSILLDLANLCTAEDKLFGFNFPSIGFLSAFQEEILEMISYGDVVFANKEEAKHFYTCITRKEINDLRLMTETLAKLPKKNKNKKRVFVVTCGPHHAYIAAYNHMTEKIEYSSSIRPWSLPVEKIVDTNGAGDSFAGGFLAYYVQGKSLEKCMLMGHWAAKGIIQVRGCDLNNSLTVPDDLELMNLYLQDKEKFKSSKELLYINEYVNEYSKTEVKEDNKQKQKN